MRPFAYGGYLCGQSGYTCSEPPPRVKSRRQELQQEVMEVRVARGVFAGMISGAVVGGLGLATLSVVNGPVEPVSPLSDEITEAPITAPEMDAEELAAATEMDETPEEPAPEPVQEPEPVSEPVSEPAPEPEPETDPVVELEPEEGGQAEPEELATQEVAPEPDAVADAEAASDPEVMADTDLGSAPGEEAVPEPAAEPEAPVEPEMTDVQPEVDQGAGEVTGLVPEPDTQPELAEGAGTEARIDETPAAPTAADPQSVPAAGEVVPVPTPLPQTEAALDPALSEAPAPQGETGAALPAVDAADMPAEAPAALEDPAQPPAAPEESEPPAPTRLKSDPVAPIGDLAPNVTTNRLPTVGAAAEAEAEPEVAVASPLAIERNSAPFERAEGLPMMSVVLRDDPAARAGLGDLAGLPFPVTFVVAAEQADAAEAIALYRAAGAEVLVSVALPEGATAVDAEVTLQAHAGLLAEAVGLQMAADFQTAGPTATQVAQVLVEGGHGLVSLPQGLNTGHKSALKVGVPAGLVFRELDNDGQSAAVIRRFLDNAAFKARQERGVILLGHARAETLQALIEWGLGNRAKSVAMAPVSAVLLDG